MTFESSWDPEIGLVVIIPPERDDKTVHDLLMDLAARHPGDQDMYVVIADERFPFARQIDGSDELYADARATLDPVGVRVFRR